MTGLMIVCILTLVLLGTVDGQTMPAACTYDRGMYECNYNTLNSGGNIPLSASVFSSPVAQRIRITHLPATLTSAIFNSNFASISTASYDTNFPATLEMKCDANSAVTIGSAAFTNMGHIRDFKVINCQLTAQASAFSQLGVLDSFIIENGTISSIDGTALSSVSIQKESTPNPTYPVQSGQFVLRDSKVSGGMLPSTLFDGLTDIVSMVIEGAFLTSINSRMFANMTSLRFLSLSYNDFSDLPATLLDSSEGLAELHLYGITYTCTCDSLWFYTRANTTHMKIYGDIICDTGDKAGVYYNNNCVKAAEECSDGLFSVMGACFKILDLSMYIVCFLSAVLATVMLICVIVTRKSLSNGNGMARGSKGKKKPLPKGGRRPLPKKPGAPKTGWA